MLQNHNCDLSVFDKAWLDVDAADHGFSIVINRTPRYITSHYHMSDLLESFRDKKAAFVGLEEEWELFCRIFGQIPLIKTENL